MKKLILLPFLIISFQINAQWIGAIFDTLTHNTVRDEVNHQCIDIDKAGNLHIVFVRENPVSGFNIFYKKRGSHAVWTPEDSVTTQTGFVPVVVASNVEGEAYVAYEGTFNNAEEIFCCSNAGGTWNCQQLTFDSTNNISPSMDIDSAGFLHLAWIGTDSAGDFKIMYATNLSGIWSPQQLSASQLGMFGSGAAPEISVDKIGIAHIAYRGDNGNGYRIHHAYNSSPGGNTWNYDIITTPNDEDLSCAIEVGKDSIVHVLVSGDDGFGFPVEAYYQTKGFSDTAFSHTSQIASSYNASVGDLFVDHDGQPHVVLNELSGNIYTGNVVYANPNTWNGIMLLNSGDVYNANLVLDEADNGYLAAYQGNAFSDEEVIIYGTQGSVGINDPLSNKLPYRLITTGNNLRIFFNENFSGRLSCISVDGKIVFNEEKNYLKDESFEITNLSSGVYIFSSENNEQKSSSKVVLR